MGGFPEPYFGGSQIEARRWSREHRNLILREEVASLERVHDLGNLELLALRLPDLVGSPLSINALREDLQVSHKTLANWIAVFERLCMLFRVMPFGPPGIRAIRKASKHYHFDWTLPEEAGARFENLVACHLLKWVHYQQDVEGRDVELRYFRDTSGREVDFVVVERRKVLVLVECKSSDTGIDRGLRYLKARYPDAAAWQVTASGRKDYQTAEGIRVGPATEFLGTLV